MSTTSDFRSRELRGSRGVDAYEHESTPSLLRRLVSDIGTLFAQELHLLKTETTTSLGDMKAAGEMERFRAAL